MKSKEYDPFKDPNMFWHKNIGCSGCFKCYYPNHPALGQKSHMDIGGCLYMESSSEEDN